MGGQFVRNPYNFVDFSLIAESVHHVDARVVSHRYLDDGLGIDGLRLVVFRTADGCDGCPHPCDRFPLSDLAAVFVSVRDEFEYLDPSVEFSDVH